jgi:acetyl esterase
MSTKKKPKKSRSSVKKQTATQIPAKRSRLWRWVLAFISLLLIVVIAAIIAFRVSPWPGALVIRYAFDKGGKETSQKLEKHVPSGISSVKNKQYRPNDKDAYLDVYYPNTIKDTDKTLPTIVWVHGGAWISGSKDNVSQYLQILASYGYTTVGVNYTIAPEKHYPTPLLQVNDALTYLQENAQELHVDPYNFVLAGDSAGSQIASQLATLITNQPYAQQVGIDPTLQPSQLRAVVLNCGAYDLASADQNGEAGKFLKTVLWAYSGTKDFKNDPDLKYASVIDYVTGDFPPTFITAGNADPLEPQSLEFAQKLQKLKVNTDALFYPKSHTPKLPHEYQFNLDNADGRQALGRITTFLGKQTK